MEDLSLHIMDVVENSIRAHAKNVKIRLTENIAKDLLVLEIEDDGEGMDGATEKECLDPFFTTKEGKKVGLGLPLLAQSFEEAGGKMVIETQRGQGTKIIAKSRLNHIDRRPLGDIENTIRCLKGTHPEINFTYEYIKTKQR